MTIIKKLDLEEEKTTVPGENHSRNSPEVLMTPIIVNVNTNNAHQKMSNTRALVVGR